MINKDTILSVYTEKQTLLEYLTKIETALDKAVLTSSQLVYDGANNYHFKFVFEDGSSIETPSITLVQPISKVDFVANGNSVHFVFTLMDGETIATQTINLLKPVTAAAVRDGILYLTLSDGTEVNAGSITASFGATTFNGDVLIHGNFHQTDGNAILGGNAEVEKDLIVDGVLKQNTYELDSDFAPIIDTVLSGDGFSCYYAHYRESNGKLNVVMAISALNPKSTHSETEKISANIILPTEVANKLHTITLSGSSNFLAAQNISATIINTDGSTPVPSQSDNMACYALLFEGTRLHLFANVNSTTTYKQLLWRFEFNFVLSKEG